MRGRGMGAVADRQLQSMDGQRVREDGGFEVYVETSGKDGCGIRRVPWTKSTSNPSGEV